MEFTNIYFIISINKYLDYFQFSLWYLIIVYCIHFKIGASLISISQLSHLQLCQTHLVL